MTIMNKRSILSSVVIACALPVMAGGFLTNTNQNALFLRNPAIDAYMRSIEGVYSNPAGSAFLGRGFHLSLNIQNAKQQRIINSTFAPFATGIKNNGNPSKEYVGKAYAPIIPSFQAGYNTGNWSFTASFGLTGGGGKCEFSEGLASFESIASLLPMMGAEQLGIRSYNMDSYMQGRQYYFGLQLGAAYKLNEHLSVYGGGRLVYATTSYNGYVKNIQIGLADGKMNPASKYFMDIHDQAIGVAAQLNARAGQHRELASRYEAAGDAATAAGYRAQAAQYEAQAAGYTKQALEMAHLSGATENVTLFCDQKGWGFTPIIGVDWKINDQWNLAAKYEFKTRLRLRNKAANSASADNLAALDQFKDGKKVAEDVPSLLTIGVQYSPIQSLRLSAGFHYFDDKHAKKYGNTQELLDGGTTEILAGAEYDINSRITASAGWQKTNYGLTDKYMKDMSFVTNSNTVGFGVRVKLTEKMNLDLSYLQTFYSTYDKKSNDYNNVSGVASIVIGQERVNELLSNQQANPFVGLDSFTRKNRAFGIGLSIDF